MKLYTSYVWPVLLVLAGLLTACGGGDDSNNHTNGNNNNNPDAAEQRLQRVDREALVTSVRQALLAQYGEVQTGYNTSQVMTEVTLDASAASAATDFSATFSATNVQEAGVDEADRVKSDGQYLYVASADQPALMVFAADAQAGKLAELTLDAGKGGPLQGMYLQGDQLLALSSPYQHGVFPLLTDVFPYPAQTLHTEVFSIDVSQPAQPRQQTVLSIEGELVSSRMIGSTLYLATRYLPVPEGLVFPQNEAQAAANRTIINAADLADFLPDYAVNKVTQGELFAAEDCFTTRYSDDMNVASIVSVVAIDTRQANPQPRGQCFLGDIETLYASTSAIYLATTRQSYTLDEDELVVYAEEASTDIHRFELSNGEIGYAGSGRIAGHLGWYQDLKPFRMSEYEDTLRVITYTGNVRDSSVSPAHLYNLQRDADSDALVVVGQLPNAQRPAALGKPGEQVYATRFLGERGYLVTYRLADPLYVLDLSDPRDPLLLGELEIEGYSDYLHPVGENFLLGVGKDAVVDNGTDAVSAPETESEVMLTPEVERARGAWYQGVKLSLIDVSNPAQPFEQQTLVLGRRGSETAVSLTHHAFTSLQQGNNLRVALPLRRHEAVNNQVVTESYNPDSPQFYYDWTQDELVRLDIDVENGIMMQRPALVGRRAGDDEAQPYSVSWTADRSVLIDGRVYYVHGDEVSTTDW